MDKKDILLNKLTSLYTKHKNSVFYRKETARREGDPCHNELRTRGHSTSKEEITTHLPTWKGQLVGSIGPVLAGIQVWGQHEGLLDGGLAQRGHLLQGHAHDDEHHRHHHAEKQDRLVTLHDLET